MARLRRLTSVSLLDSEAISLVTILADTVCIGIIAKIGMLPKRQVSLLGTSPSATNESVHKQIQPASTSKRDGKDDLDGEEEYTK